MRDHPGEDGQMRYAEALARWGEAGGYEAEVLFDTCTHAAFGQGYPGAPRGGSRRSPAASASGSRSR